MFECVYKQKFHISQVRISQKVCFNVKPLIHYFYVKTRILEDFHIFISVPLSHFVVKHSAKTIHHFIYRTPTVAGSGFTLPLGRDLVLRKSFRDKLWRKKSQRSQTPLMRVFNFYRSLNLKYFRLLFVGSTTYRSCAIYNCLVGVLSNNNCK